MFFSTQTKVKISKVLHELEESICNEMYSIPENINDDDADLIDTSIKDIPSKFKLQNINPEFGKCDDPFRSLGPIAVSFKFTKFVHILHKYFIGIFS